MWADRSIWNHSSPDTREVGGRAEAGGAPPVVQMFKRLSAAWDRYETLPTTRTHLAPKVTALSRWEKGSKPSCPQSHQDKDESKIPPSYLPQNLEKNPCL